MRQYETRETDRGEKKLREIDRGKEKETKERHTKTKIIKPVTSIRKSFISNLPHFPAEQINSKNQSSLIRVPKICLSSGKVAY